MNIINLLTSLFYARNSYTLRHHNCHIEGRIVMYILFVYC